LAALEAMACKVVPITTRVGGLPEVIEHGRNGFMADVGDIDTMAQYAIDLLSDPKKLDIMAVQARATAQARFCSTKIIPLYEAFYRRVLERSS
jgi:glycosyltransferase involved in cell wall biosynthesis